MFTKIIFLIEITIMEMSRCRNLICDCNLPFSEEQKQEHEASTYNYRTNTSNRSSNTFTQHRNKQIFSFRYSKFRRQQQQQKFKSPKHAQIKFDLGLGSPQPFSTNLYSRQIVTNNLLLKNNLRSALSIGPNSFGKVLREEQLVKQNRSQQLFSFKSHQQTNSMNCTSKMERKCQNIVGIKINYSPNRQLFSNKSQINSNNCKITLKKNQQICRNNNVIIQETQSSKTFSIQEFIEPNRGILEELSPRIIVNKTQLINARTIQSIKSPTHTISCSPNRVSSQLLTMRAFKETPSAVELQQQIVKYNTINDHISTISVTNNKNTSQCLDCSNQMQENQSDQFLKQQNLKNGYFYTQMMNNQGIKSQRISVLDLRGQNSRIDNDQEEELRDVIDNNVPSLKTNINRPSITIICHKRHVIENDKFENSGSDLSQFSNYHSRQASIDELAMLTKARANLRRTNTVESMHSEESVISSVDIKFMQQLRAIPGQVIRLV